MAAPTAEQLVEQLKYHFGLEAFRPLQLEAVQTTLAGRDSLLILATGGGKSITFQLPPLARGNCFTVVVCPLIALAKDQVDKCLEAGIEVAMWNSEVTEAQRRNILSELVSDAPDLRLLYTTPEALTNPTLRSYLQEAYEQGTLCAFAVDEAHCVCSWDSFRPAFLELASLKTDFPNVPVTAMTASATPGIQASIIKGLGLRDPVIIKSTHNRPNIAYEVRYKELIGHGTDDCSLQDLVGFVKARSDRGEVGIIYARLRATCDALTAVLAANDVEVSSYHAGKDAQYRRRVLEDWMAEGGVVVSTIAFGMGIDKSNVRFVVHWNAPGTMEGFLQESGRAGRDGLPSKSLMYLSHADLEAIRCLERGSRQGGVAVVAQCACETGCKRRKLLAHFSEARGPCDASVEQLCDYCTDRSACSKRIALWKEKVAANAAQQQQQQQQHLTGQQGGSQLADDEDAVGCAGPQQQQSLADAKPDESMAARAITGWSHPLALAADTSRGRGAGVRTGRLAPHAVPRQALEPLDTAMNSSVGSMQPSASAAAEKLQAAPKARHPVVLKRRRSMFSGPRFVSSGAETDQQTAQQQLKDDGDKEDEQASEAQAAFSVDGDKQELDGVADGADCVPAASASLVAPPARKRFVPPRRKSQA